MRRRVLGSRKKLLRWIKVHPGYYELWLCEGIRGGGFTSFLHQRKPCSCSICSYYKYRKIRSSKKFKLLKEIEQELLEYNTTG